ncbi:Nucleosome assembly protein 1-like 1, partial [Camelus dromedarius]
MSATEERGRIPGGRDTAGGWAGGDNRLLGVGVSPLEGMDGVQGVFRALPEDEGWQEEVAEAAVEENWAVELGEEEEDLEETEEEEEEGEGEEFEFEFEDQEEEEYQSEEGDEDEEEDEEEEEGETEEEEENGQEGTEVVSGAREAPTVRFGSLFRNLVHSVLPRVPSSDRDLVRPHAGRVVARRRSWQPLDLAEGPAPPQEVEARGEGPVPQEREDLGEEAEVWGGEALADASQSWEAGACGPEGRAQAGEWRPSPQALAAPVGASGPKAGGVQRLPLAVTQRVKALKNLQARHAQVEAQFYKDLFDLEKKYAAFYEPLFDRRAAIINAIHEPSEGECQWAVGVAEGAWEEMDAEPEGKGQINGIPHFWLTAFKNVKMLGRMIRGNDELALEHLTDVKIKFSGVEEPMSFTVEFIFESNEYFFNKVLTKTYRMRSDPDDSDPFFSRGPEIISSTGCEIYWKEGKDLTMKTLELQKCEGRGSVVPATGKVPSRSFFTYFYPPDSPEVTQRVKALKNLQARHAQVEAQFYKDLFDLEKKYAAFYEPLFDRRAAIINAIHEPSEGECQWAVGVAEGAWEEMDAEPEGKGQINGIPHFWLTAFKNVKMLGRMIRGNDELALEHLTDVKIKFSGVEEPMSFTVEFIFESNEYFFNKVLTKTYRMRSDPDDSDPFFSRGPEIISSTGCEIYWKEGKDLTMKTLELQKCEGRGSVVPATGKVPSRSFFTYFYPPDSPE